jgi:arsenical-resistance protein 2
MESLVLEEGIKGWATGGEDFVMLMDGYEESYWK